MIKRLVLLDDEVLLGVCVVQLCFSNKICWQENLLTTKYVESILTGCRENVKFMCNFDRGRPENINIWNFQKNVNLKWRLLIRNRGGWNSSRILFSCGLWVISVGKPLGSTTVISGGVPHSILRTYKDTTLMDYWSSLPLSCFQNILYPSAYTKEASMHLIDKEVECHTVTCIAAAM